MISVAYVVPPLRSASGWRSYCRHFLPAISRFVAPVLYVSSEDSDEAAALFPDWPHYTLPMIQDFAFANAPSIPHILAARWRAARVPLPPVDVVHSLEAYPTGLIGSWLVKRAGCSHVITGHGTYSINAAASVLDRMAYSRVLRDASMFCPISDGTMGLLRQHFPAESARLPMRVVRHGTAYCQLVPRHEAMHRRAASVPTVLSVGAIKPRKGYHVSLAAFALLKRRVPSARYWIVGRVDQPEYLKTLQRFIEQEHLEDVHFLGELSPEALRKCYQDASLFALAPQQVGFSFEGFGLVFLEAGAYGLPVVATRTGGVADAIDVGTTGLLTDPSDREGLAAAMERLLTDHELARRMGLANRERAEMFTWERSAIEMNEIYELFRRRKSAVIGSTG